MNEKEKLFLEACFVSNRDMVKELMEEGVNIAASDEKGDNCLHKAVKGGDEDFTEFIFKKVPSLQLVANSDNLTPLEMTTSVDIKSNPFLNACIQGNLEEVKKFFKDGVLNMKDDLRDYGAYLAALHNKVEVLKFLLEKGCDVNSIISTEKYKESTLHAAVRMTSLECIDVLLRYDCDVNLQDGKGMTALMISVSLPDDLVYNERLEKVFEKLIATQRCNYTLTDIKYGDNVLHAAAVTGNSMAVTKLLDDAPALINSINKDGDTALHLAALAGGNTVIDVLLNADKSVIDKKGDRGNTALQYALQFDEMDTIELLVTRGANCSIQNDDEETVLHDAFRKYISCCENSDECNKKDILTESEFILKMYENLPQSWGRKCVYLAVAVYLIQYGNANIHIKNKNGQSPIDFIPSDVVGSDVLKAYFN